MKHTNVIGNLDEMLDTKRLGTGTVESGARNQKSDMGKVNVARARHQELKGVIS